MRPPTVHYTNRSSGLALSQATRNDNVWEALARVPLDREMTGELPPSVWPVLKENLPKGGLLQFLRRFPDKFVVVSERPLIWKRVS